MSKIISVPKHTVIEDTALALAAAWYEIGRSQGLKSKHKNARLYAAHNIEKFIPKACDYLLDMLNQNNISPHMKDEIYSALMERHNDPTLVKYMPNIDVTKVLHFAEMAERKKPIEIAVDKALQSLKADVQQNKVLLAQPDFENSTREKDIFDGKEDKAAGPNAEHG